MEGQWNTNAFRYLFVTVLILIYLNWSQAQSLKKYCNTFCNDSGTLIKHSLCTKDACALYPDCSEDLFTTDVQFMNDMIMVHNVIRRKTAVGDMSRFGLLPASDMRAFRYNFELELMGQCAAGHCTDLPYRCLRTEKFVDVSQTIYTYRDSKYYPIEIGWLIYNFFLYGVRERHAKLKRTTNAGKMGRQKFDEAAISATEKLIWSKTDNFGCGRTHSADRWYVACNYAPANYSGGVPYEPGTVCSMCENYECSTHADFNGLCDQPNIRKKLDDKATTYLTSIGYIQILIALGIVALVCIIFEYGESDAYE